MEFDCVIHCARRGNFANYMMKYMAAIKISEMISEAKFSGYQFPYWDIDFPDLPSQFHTTAVVRDDMQIDYLRILYLLENRAKTIAMTGHYQRMENFPSIERTRSLFRLKDHLGTEFNDDFIVCPVRAGEILGAIHPGYTVIPVAFYKDVLSKETARPVFMGQIEPNQYIDDLRAAFPDAIFLPSQGAFADFHTICRARKIVLPVSTFAWLAAWMSNATKIVLPVFGLFNFHAHPGNELLPVFDHRYEFYRFPL